MPKSGSKEAEILSDLLNLVNGTSDTTPLTPDMARSLAGGVDVPKAVAAPLPLGAVAGSGAGGVDVPKILGVPVPEPVEDTRIFIEDKWHAALSAPEAPKQIKLFFTGRLGSGKDYLASIAKCKVLGFADPLYSVAAYYFGLEVSANKNKDLPGMRQFLQQVGQWGRGTVSDAYPLTPARALFVQRIRSDGAAGMFGSIPVEWDSYGRNENIWLDSLIARAAASTDARIAVTNCRFQNEFERLQKEGFQHWHCMCSPKTWGARLAKQNLTPESPAVKDLSEQLAAKLDANVIRQCSAQKNGAPLTCVWNDEQTAPPSPRLTTVAGFLKSVGGSQ